MTATIAITGADGFVGAHLGTYLEQHARTVIRVVRRTDGIGANRRVLTDFSNIDAMAHALYGATAVVHLAARAHILRESCPVPANAYHEANVLTTASLCRSAKAAGVRRIVYVSSIGVNGARTEGTPFTERDPPRPTELYAQSKWEAENTLRGTAELLDIEYVIVRPPLVYGPGVKGNFLRLLRLAASGLPLPLATIDNRRSLIGVENLAALLMRCIDHPAARSQLYLAAEPVPHSSGELLRALREAMHYPSRLFSVPQRALEAAVRIAGLRRAYDKLCSSLEVCSDKARRDLGWIPAISFEEEIARTANWYLKNQHVTR